MGSHSRARGNALSVCDYERHNSAAHADARASAVLCKSPGARAGGCERYVLTASGKASTK